MLKDADAVSNNRGLGDRSRLAVVCWGGNGRTRIDSDDKYKLKQIPFVRGTKTDPFRDTSLLAMKTVWRMVQFIEPESDILNHSVRKPYLVKITSEWGEQRFVELWAN